LLLELHGVRRDGLKQARRSNKAASSIIMAAAGDVDAMVARSSEQRQTDDGWT